MFCESHQHIYRPPTKLWEGHVFSCVYLSVILFTVGSHVTITHDELESTIQGVPSPKRLLWTWDVTVQESPALGPGQ